MLQLSGIIEQLQLAMGAKNKADLARKLNLRPSNITDAIRRGSIPDEWIYKVAYETGVRVEWLRTGDGPKHLNEQSTESSPQYRAMLKEAAPLLEHWHELSDDAKSIVEKCLVLVKQGELELLRDLLNAVSRRAEYDRTKK